MKPYYADDSVTLYHGDCREVLPALTGYGAIVTDPPYGLGDLLRREKAGRWSKLHFDGAITWDAEPPEIVATLPTMARHAIIWGGNYFPLPLRRGWLIWDKIIRNFSSGEAELAWTTLDQPIRTFSYSHGQLVHEGKVHPTQKPVSLMEWCIRFLPPDCVTILDPFTGSGSTLVAAKNEGRRAIGIEAHEPYCELAAKRLTQGVLDLTGANGPPPLDPFAKIGDLRPLNSPPVERPEES